jgi:hypothetical protein
MIPIAGQAGFAVEISDHQGAIMDPLTALKQHVQDLIRQNDLNAALDAVTQFVKQIVQDPQATAEVFGSQTLDQLCQGIGAQALLGLKPAPSPPGTASEPMPVANRFPDTTPSHKPPASRIVYIVTEIYKTGGHGAVLADFIQAYADLAQPDTQPDTQQVILVTDLFGIANFAEVDQRFAPLPVTLRWSQPNTLLEKLSWLQQQLAQIQPTQVFLFNHWFDAVAIAAVQPSLTPQLFFYHHCDHQLCLGLFLPHAHHIDLHSTGFYTCQQMGVQNQLYIPLVAEDLGSRVKVRGDRPSGWTTCTSGSYNKFESPYDYSYIELLPQILASSGGTHIHIGTLPGEVLQQIAANLQVAGIAAERFVYQPWVPSLWDAIKTYEVDIYLNSFPLGGGRASVEVMGSGTAMIGHYNYNSRLLSSFDVIYPEAFFWHHPEELAAHLAQLAPSQLADQAAHARRHYEAYHHPQILKQCLKNAPVAQIEPPLLRPYGVEQLRQFFHRLHQNDSHHMLAMIDQIRPIFDQNHLYRDRHKWSEFLYWITTASMQMEQTEADLISTRTALDQTSHQISRIQIELDSAKTELDSAKQQVVSAHQYFERTQAELREAQLIIQAMSSSKFWQMRELWMRWKHRILPRG